MKNTRESAAPILLFTNADYDACTFGFVGHVLYITSEINLSPFLVLDRRSRGLRCRQPPTLYFNSPKSVQAVKELDLNEYRIFDLR